MSLFWGKCPNPGSQWENNHHYFKKVPSLSTVAVTLCWLVELPGFTPAFSSKVENPLLQCSFCKISTIMLKLYALEVQTLFYMLVYDPTLLGARVLGSSKGNHHFFNTVLDFQGKLELGLDICLPCPLQTSDV